MYLTLLLLSIPLWPDLIPSISFIVASILCVQSLFLTLKFYTFQKVNYSGLHHIIWFCHFKTLTLQTSLYIHLCKQLMKTLAHLYSLRSVHWEFKLFDCYIVPPQFFVKSFWPFLIEVFTWCYILHLSFTVIYLYCIPRWESAYFWVCNVFTLAWVQVLFLCIDLGSENRSTCLPLE